MGKGPLHVAGTFWIHLTTVVRVMPPGLTWKIILAAFRRNIQAGMMEILELENEFQRCLGCWNGTLPRTRMFPSLICSHLQEHLLDIWYICQYWTLRRKIQVSETRTTSGHGGTMFRFPLRTASQAECSDLSKETWSMERMSEVFEQFQVGESLVAVIRHISWVWPSDILLSYGSIKMCLFVNGKLFRWFSEDLWLILTYDIHLPYILSLFWAKESKSLSWMMGCKKVCPGGMRSHASLPKIRHSVAGLFESVPLCHVNDGRIDPLKWIMLLWISIPHIYTIIYCTIFNWHGDSLWLMSLDVLWVGKSLDVWWSRFLASPGQESGIFFAAVPGRYTFAGLSGHLERKCMHHATEVGFGSLCCYLEDGKSVLEIDVESVWDWGSTW